MNCEDFVAPKREIMTIFDISKWYKSEVRFFKNLFMNIYLGI